MKKISVEVIHTFTATHSRCKNNIFVVLTVIVSKCVGVTHECRAFIMLYAGVLNKDQLLINTTYYTITFYGITVLTGHQYFTESFIHVLFTLIHTLQKLY